LASLYQPAYCARAQDDLVMIGLYCPASFLLTCALLPRHCFLLHIISLQGSLLSHDSEIFYLKLPKFSSFVYTFNSNDFFGLYFAYSKFFHLKNCLCSKKCATCNNLISRYIAHIHSTLGFLPSLPFPVYINVVSNTIITVYYNISSYHAAQQHHNGLPNFIYKLAPVASQIDIKLS
jgi:hypothetical protein